MKKYAMALDKLIKNFDPKKCPGGGGGGGG